MKRLILLSFAALAFAQDPVSITPFQLLDSRSGSVRACSGCSVYTYAAGTNTPLVTYTNSTLGTPNTNPVLTNSAGYAVNGSTVTGIWVGSACYKFIAKDASGTTIYTQDNICDRGAVLKAQLAAVTGANLIGFEPTGGTVATTVGAALNSAFLYDIGFSTAANACASSKTVAVTSNALWAGLSTMTCAANLWFPTGIGFTGIEPASGQVFTQTGSIIASDTQRVFNIASGGTVVGGSAAAVGNGVSGWWFTAPDGSTDNAAGLQAAVNYFGSRTSFRGGKITLCGPFVITDTVLVEGRKIEFAGCGWGDQNATPKGPYLKWGRGSTSTTKDMITIACTEGVWIHDLRFIGSPTFPPQAAIGMKQGSCSAGYAGGNQMHRLERLAIGNYPVSDSLAPQMTYGVYAYGLNGNDDSMSMDTVFITNANTCIYQSFQQNVLWSVNNLGCTFSVTSGLKLAAGGNYTNLTFSGNPIDIDVVVSADASPVSPIINITGMSSEGSSRFIRIGVSASPSINITGGTWGFGNGNTPVDDGACATTVAPYDHCSKIIQAAGKVANIHFNDFAVLGGASAAGYQWIADFSNPSLTANQFDLDWQGTIRGGEAVSPHILLGSASSGSNFNAHYRLNNSSANTNTEQWEYFGGYLMGNLTYFIPQDGVIMHDDMRPATTTCTGTCTLDLTKGLVQTFILTGDVTSWVAQPAGGTDATAQILGWTRGGQGRMTITMCSSGGGYSAVSPTYFGGQAFGGWGFGSAITINTCAQQDFLFTGQGGIRTNAINSASAYITGIAP